MFLKLLDAHKQQMEISLASATVTLWAFTNTARIQPQYSDCENLEGFLQTRVTRQSRLSGCLQTPRYLMIAWSSLLRHALLGLVY